MWLGLMQLLASFAHAAGLGVAAGLLHRYGWVQCCFSLILCLWTWCGCWLLPLGLVECIYLYMYIFLKTWITIGIWLSTEEIFSWTEYKHRPKGFQQIMYGDRCCCFYVVSLKAVYSTHMSAWSCLIQSLQCHLPFCHNSRGGFHSFQWDCNCIVLH